MSSTRGAALRSGMALEDLLTGIRDSGSGTRDSSVTQQRGTDEPRGPSPEPVACASTIAAPFSPQPATPGYPSAESPTSPSQSGIDSGFTPNFATTPISSRVVSRRLSTCMQISIKGITSSWKPGR